MKKFLFAAILSALCVNAVASDDAPKSQVKKIAVFVQNRTKVPGMDDEVDGVRDRLSSALAEVEGLSIVDSTHIADVFRRFKVTVNEEKSGAVDGIFKGGSVSSVAKMLSCDFIAMATIVNANAIKRNVSGRLSTVYSLRMSLKVMDSSGASVDGMPLWARQYPVLDVVDDPMNYYQILFDLWAKDATGAIAQKSQRWSVSSDKESALVSFSVSTTIDSTVAELESQTRGSKGEQLQELRRIAGGVTVEIDGAAVGSTPGTFFVKPGLHRIKVNRMWMKPYVATVNVYDGMALNVALELSDEGVAKWGSIEALRADLAKRYAEAARERGVRVNIDTTRWRDVGNAAGVHVVNEK